VNYRSYFQARITEVQRQLDTAMQAGNWLRYLHLRHEMIEIKEHVTAHESICGYDCECMPDEAGERLLHANS